MNMRVRLAVAALLAAAAGAGWLTAPYTPTKARQC
jgi:hypothetical protein